MRRTIHKALLVAGGALALAGQARANTISVGSNPSTVPDGPNFKWTYAASLLNGKVRTGEGLITIYDFAGFVPGSAFSSDPNWTFSSNVTGTTPSDLAPVGNLFDDLSIPNLTWMYTGPELISPNTSISVPLGTFGADSTLSASILDKYVTQDRSNPSDAAPDGAVSGSFGSTDVPVNRQVPDSGSSVMLLGLALLGLGGLARKSALA